LAQKWECLDSDLVSACRLPGKLTALVLLLAHLSNISVISNVPNVGLCRQRFSWIDGIQVIARLVCFLPSVCRQSYGESRLPAELARVSAYQARKRQAFPRACWPRTLVTWAGCLLLLAEGQQLGKCPTKYRSSTVCEAGVVSWKETAHPGRDFSPASTCALEWSSYSLTLVALLLLF